ncbi:MAG: hypothetical protein GX639_10830 [Fibrobacter sp.]|nr:hypothetical protein [Fibrobacter sp.]
MRFVSALLCLFAFLCSSVSAETLISGNISGITFDVAKNPYIVEKDIIVPKGTSVSIPEGIVFLFHPFTGFQVSGRVAVQGSDTKMVIFTSLNDNIFNTGAEQLPNPFDWNGIYVSKDAEGAFLNNFALKYSVYGIKSQCQNIIIQNAVFQQNGQFNFTVNEQIKLVVEGMPFSYPDSLSGSTITTAKDSNVVVKPKPLIDKGTPAKNSEKKLKIFRYTCLGVGAVGAVTAMMYGVSIKTNLDKMNEISEDSNNNNASDPNGAKKWHEAERNYNNSIIGCSVAGGLGALGLIGFGVSFAF